MSDEPTNAAAEFSPYGVGMLNDESFMKRDGLSLVTPDLVRYDRRSLTVQPVVGREVWLESVIGLGEAAGSWPAFSMPEVLAVRGERLVVYRLMICFEDGSELEQLVLSQIDESCRYCAWPGDPDLGYGGD